MNGGGFADWPSEPFSFRLKSAEEQSDSAGTQVQ